MDPRTTAIELNYIYIYIHPGKGTPPMKEQQFARIFIWANTSEQLANSTAENSSVLNIRDVDPLT